MPAVGFVVLSNLTTVGIVTTGCVGSRSIKRIAMTEAPGGGQAPAVLGDEREDLSGSNDGLVCDCRNTFEEELNPGLPVAASSNFAEQSVILSPVTLEEETKIQERRRQQFPVL